MDIIYSRRKIKFKKLNRIQKLKLKTIALVFIILFLIVFYLLAIYPAFISSCETKASSIAVNIVNEEANNIMKDYNYDDLVNVEKDTDGKIKLLQIKVGKVNSIVNQITRNIQKSIDSPDTGIVDVNFGKVIGVKFLSNLGPKFKIELEKGGKILTDISSEFESVGINQTIHRLNLKIKCEISLLTPIEKIVKTVETKVILAETVIIGEIPENYYYYDDINSDKVLDAQ